MHIVLLYRKQNFDLIQSVKLLAAHNFTAFTLLLCKSNYEGRKKKPLAQLIFVLLKNVNEKKARLFLERK